MRNIFWGSKTNHHIIPKSRAEEWYKVHSPINQEHINHKVHEDLHRLFVNQTPVEQFKTLLEINQKVMQRRTVKKLQDILNSGDFYKDEVIK